MDSGALTQAPDAGLAIAEGSGNLLGAIITLARDPTVDVAKLQALMEMQERLEIRQGIQAFNRAFHTMEPNFPRVKKNGLVEYPANKNQPEGPKKKAFNYARWEDVDDAIRPLLRQHGFHLAFNTAQRAGDGGGVVVTGKLKHVDGHQEEASFALPLDTSGGKSNLQGYASSTSFGQRYCTKLLLNIVFEGEDDDGVKGGLTFLSEDQAGELQALMRETNTNETAFLGTMGFAPDEVHSITELEASDFARAKNSLLFKKRQRLKTQ